MLTGAVVTIVSPDAPLMPNWSFVPVAIATGAALIGSVV